MRRVALLLLLTALVAAGVAENSTQRAAALQASCQSFDETLAMAEYSAQLAEAHDLMLLNEEQLPDAVADRLRGARDTLQALHGWLRSLRSRLAVLLGPADPAEELSHQAAEAGSLNGAFDHLVAVSRASERRGSADAWGSLCPKTVLVRPFMAALESLQAQIKAADNDITAHSFEVFELRAEWAAAAGALSAAPEDEGQKETIAGLRNISQRVERAIWPNEAFRRHVQVALVNVMEKERLIHKQVEEPFDLEQAKPPSASEPTAADAATTRLRILDRQLLEESRTHLRLREERKQLAERAKNHLKAMMAQCLPPEEGAARSRYARFAHASPGSNAVRLILETDDFLARSLATTAPALATHMASALLDAAREDVSAQDMGDAPSLQHWQQWLPSLEEAGFVGFQDFAEAFRAAERRHDQALARGGRVAALRSLWRGLVALGERLPQDDAPVRVPSERDGSLSGLAKWLFGS